MPTSWNLDTPVNFLWEHVKFIVYTDKPVTVAALKNNKTTVIGGILTERANFLTVVFVLQKIVNTVESFL